MAKRRSGWLWIAGALFIGYLLGDDDTNSNYKPSNSIVQTQPEPQPVSITPQPQTPAVTVVPRSSPSKSKPTTLQRAPKSATKPATAPPSKPVILPTLETMYVDASRLNVRNGPSKSDKVIWTLKRGQKVTVAKHSGDWSFVKGGRFEGWVFSTYLTPKPSPPKQQIASVPKATGPSVAQIKQLLIQRSHAYYSGNCPCPYNTTASGRRCGGRSAYSRPGGASPLCYPSDVSEAMVAEYQARQ
ncbi:MAG: SH3 domain-containing protein [Rhizobiaceae bacterium]|nr:SH3 domain-containing protein [Rhizobiaceae bacterium]